MEIYDLLQQTNLSKVGTCERLHQVFHSGDVSWPAEPWLLGPNIHQKSIKILKVPWLTLEHPSAQGNSVIFLWMEFGRPGSRRISGWSAPECRSGVRLRIPSESAVPAKPNSIEYTLDVYWIYPMIGLILNYSNLFHVYICFTRGVSLEERQEHM